MLRLLFLVFNQYYINCYKFCVLLYNALSNTFLLLFCHIWDWFCSLYQNYSENSEEIFWQLGKWQCVSRAARFTFDDEEPSSWVCQIRMSGNYLPFVLLAQRRRWCFTLICLSVCLCVCVLVIKTTEWISMRYVIGQRRSHLCLDPDPRIFFTNFSTLRGIGQFTQFGSSLWKNWLDIRKISS